MGAGSKAFAEAIAAANSFVQSHGFGLDVIPIPLEIERDLAHTRPAVLKLLRRSRRELPNGSHLGYVATLWLRLGDASLGLLSCSSVTALYQRALRIMHDLYGEDEAVGILRQHITIG